MLFHPECGFGISLIPRTTSGGRRVFSGDLLGSDWLVWLGGRSDVGGTFEEPIFLKDGAGLHEGRQLRGVNFAPAGLGGVDEFVGHRQPGSA
jgi:hypothetical protein